MSDWVIVLGRNWVIKLGKIEEITRPTAWSKCKFWESVGEKHSRGKALLYKSKIIMVFFKFNQIITISKYTKTCIFLVLYDLLWVTITLHVKF